MKIGNQNNNSSEMSMAISNSMKEFTSGKISKEEGLEAIDSAISKALTEGISSKDILSLSQEALQMGQEQKQQKSFSMKTEDSMKAEKAAAKPKGIDASVADEARWLTPSGKVSPSLQNIKKLESGMKEHEGLFNKLNQMTEEEVEQALEALAQKLQDESVVAESLENAKNTPARDTVVEQDNAPAQDSSKAPSQDSGSDSGDNTEAVITSGGGDSEATISTGTDNAEPVIAKPSSGSDSSDSEPKISKGSSDDSERPEVKVRTAKRPPAPSIDVVV